MKSEEIKELFKQFESTTKWNVGVRENFIHC